MEKILVIILILVAFCNAKTIDSKEFSLDLINSNYKDKEELTCLVKTIFDHTKEEKLLPKKCKFNYSFKKSKTFYRNDTAFDTSSLLLLSNQAKLRLRTYEDGKADLTFKYSSPLKRFVEDVNTKSSDKYESKTKIEQNIYGWDIYSRNFYHKSTKIVDLLKYKDPDDGWTVGYTKKFFPDFRNVFDIDSDKVELYVSQTKYLVLTTDIELLFDGYDADFSIEFGYSEPEFKESSLIKVELSWKIKKEKEWDDRALFCSLELLHVLQEYLK